MLYIGQKIILAQRRQGLTCSQRSQNVPNFKKRFENSKNVDISIIINNKYILVRNVHKNIYTLIGCIKKHKKTYTHISVSKKKLRTAANLRTALILLGYKRKLLGTSCEQLGTN